MIPRIAILLSKLNENLTRRVTETAVYLHLKTFFLFLKKHQKMTAWGTGVFAVISLNIIREENKMLIAEKADLVLEVSNLKQSMGNTSTTMNDIDFPMYRKMKMQDWTFRINAVNKAYELYYKVDRFQMLGSSNTEIAPGEVGEGWRISDSLVLARWEALDTLEFARLNDSLIIPVYSHKFPGRDGLDSLVYGMSIPINKFAAVLNKDGCIEFIPIN